MAFRQSCGRKCLTATGSAPMYRSDAGEIFRRKQRRKIRLQSGQLGMVISPYKMLMSVGSASIAVILRKFPSKSVLPGNVFCTEFQNRHCLSIPCSLLLDQDWPAVARLNKNCYQFHYRTYKDNQNGADDMSDVRFRALMPNDILWAAERKPNAAMICRSPRTVH